MSSLYALLVTRKHDSLRHSFCQVVLIIFRLCKNVIKFAPFISQSILSVAFMCQIWILNLFSLWCLFCIIIVLLTFSFVQAEKKLENQTFSRLTSTNFFSGKKKKSHNFTNCLALFSLWYSFICWIWETLERVWGHLNHDVYESPLSCGCHRH